jgi:hypothetical protein
LLAAAFDAGDPDKAEEFVGDVVAEGAAKWKMDTILSDLEASIAHISDIARQARLAAIIAALRTA